ncbi:hypothetical protein [Microbacterium sp. NPDC086615]|uniref:hypothetical protein n=1 Tax=Microbacterium sp. NPDC086615 TaxID=3154865 RepID=UPI003422441A
MNEKKQAKVRVVGVEEPSPHDDAALRKVARAAILIAGRELRDKSAQRAAREDSPEEET